MVHLAYRASQEVYLKKQRKIYLYKGCVDESVQQVPSSLDEARANIAGSLCLQSSLIALSALGDDVIKLSRRRESTGYNITL